jgi:predicted ABC-type ATPase
MPTIIVLAGTNGGGKSSIGGEVLKEAGIPVFDPDEATRKLVEANPEMSAQAANSLAWGLGRKGLERAIEERLSFAFETTLGGRTMTDLLLKASNVGLFVRIWYVGLASSELHIERVRARVSKGGHDIPEAKIRQRFDDSRANLIRLVPHIAELKVFDNSAEADPSGQTPRPQMILHLRRGEVIAACSPGEVPDWAKPIVLAVRRHFGAARWWSEGRD